jgi:cytochrome c oxidase cbb3-type subunit 3
VPDIRPHEVDGIQEYDNPLPRWWLYGFYASIAFAIAYAVMYPSLWFWHGTTKWSSAAQYEQIMQNAPKPSVAAAPHVDLEKLAADQATVAAGREIFKTYCVACHGENAEGKIGPPLVPHRWRYGGKPDEILTTIRGGRPGGMPTWGKVLPEEKIETVAAYVFSLSHGESAPDPPSPGPATTPTGSGQTPVTTGQAGAVR